MKKNKLHFGLAAVTGLIALSACSADDAVNSVRQENSDDISLISSMGGMTRSVTELQTNAVSTDVIVGAFGMAGTSAVTNGTNNQYKVQSTGALKAEDKEMKWPKNTTDKVDIYAYAPYQSGWTYNAANSFSVSTDQSTDAGYLASDLLYASAIQLSQTSTAIPLNFTHKLARLNVTLEKSENAVYDLSKSTVYVTNTKTATTLNPSTGALGEASGDVNSIQVAADLNIGESTIVYGVVVPQELASDTKLVRIKTNDDKYLTAKIASAVTFEAGKSYNFTATVGTDDEAVLTLGSVTLTGWGTPTDIGTAETEEVEPEPITTTATFKTPSSNATYVAPTYTWTSGSNNLMTVFEFANGELANYHTLKVTFSNLSEGASVRVGYYVGSEWTALGTFYSAGEKTIDLKALDIDLSTVTKIAFGGNSGSGGTCDIVESDVVLYGVEGGVEPSPAPVDGNTLVASFGTPGGNASYDANTYTYTWTASTSNLMNCFTFANGELADYKTLTFKFTDKTDGSVRINLLFSDNTNANTNSGYYSAGEKVINLATDLASVLGSHTLADVTAIRFGGNSGAGSTVIKASEMILSKE